MSISSSIFQKPCPACAVSVSVSATRCDCGHLFESSGNCPSPEQTALRDEELYEGYLAARAEQSQQAAHTAEQALAEDTSNPELISAATLAREVAKSIENDLAEQRSKIAAMRSALRIKEPAVRIQAESATTPTRPSAATAKAKGKAAPARPVVKVPAPELPKLPAAAIPAAAHVAKPAPAKTFSTPVWLASTAQKAAGVLSALKKAKARETTTRAPQAITVTAQAKPAAAPTVPPPQPASVTASSTVPPSEFKKEQASRAEKIMEAHKSADAKDCPNCTSSVPLTTTRCRCGFAFVSDGNDLPSLTLCTGDFTALRDSLKLNLRS